jgi:ADP-heptose:LPS heptosyltransferase
LPTGYRPAARSAPTGSAGETEGDPGCATAIARELGWSGPLPVPPLAPALRAGKPTVAAGTLAIHAGCKAGWPWKKWHGHGELAQHFGRVLRVGTPADEDASGTYFATPIRWPAHVQDATTPRALAETARLIAQCSAMVANDSGLMHLAAALGVPTLGIFGLTSPAREAMPWPALHPLSGGLACEPACRSQPWGRRDCQHHLQCLQGMDPERVAARLREIAPSLGPPGTPRPIARPAAR